jgi:hypothetical protein
LEKIILLAKFSLEKEAFQKKIFGLVDEFHVVNLVEFFFKKIILGGLCSRPFFPWQVVKFCNFVFSVFTVFLGHWPEKREVF